MRQNRTFPPARRQPEPEPAPPPSRLDVLRQKLRGFYARYQYAFLLALGIAITLAVLLGIDSFKPPPQRLTQHDIDNAVARALASATPGPSFESLVYQVIHPSIVRIQAHTTSDDMAIGTGVVIDDTGSILSSLHVVNDATDIQVFFADGTESAASIEMKQSENDMVVLHPDVIPDDLVPATLAGSGGLQVGDDVVVVGNPFGISNSLSAGVVSGLGRFYKSQKTGMNLTNLIQFDAAVNPGNSGGPLLNRNGEVVGIVTALLNPTEQDVFIGIGFAVPIETAASGLGSPPY